MMSAAARHRLIREWLMPPSLIGALSGAFWTTGSAIDFPVFTFPFVQPSFTEIFMVPEYCLNARLLFKLVRLSGSARPWSFNKTN